MNNKLYKVFEKDLSCGKIRQIAPIEAENFKQAQIVFARNRMDYEGIDQERMPDSEIEPITSFKMDGFRYSIREGEVVEKSVKNALRIPSSMMIVREAEGMRTVIEGGSSALDNFVRICKHNLEFVNNNHVIRRNVSQEKIQQIKNDLALAKSAMGRH